MKSLRHGIAIILLLTFVVLFSQQESELGAQQKNVVPIVVSPQAPTISPISPLGLPKSGSQELTLIGTNLLDPIGVWTSFPAKITIPTDNNNGKDATKLRVKIDLPNDTPIGYGSIRLSTKNGISNTRLVCIDDLPQVDEVGTNRTKMTAQEIPIPCVVVGRTDAELSDFFKIRVKANQRVSIEVIGHRLGSLLDPIILVHDARTGKEIPSLYSDDAPGLQTDARLTFSFKEDGEYLIEIRDMTHRGGVEYYYRLRIGDFPFAITPFPVAVKRGSKSSVQFAGPSVDGVSPVEVNAPTDPMIQVVNVTPKRAEGQSGWPVSVLLSDMDQVVEQEPNTDPSKPNRLNLPCGVTGRFLEKSDIDHFVFAAKKGQKYSLVAETYEILSPAEVYLTVKNAKGGEVGKSNPQNTPAKIEFTPDADGDYTIVVEHLNYAHGPNEIYHLTVQPETPDFDVVLGLDRFDIAPGGTTVIPVMSVVRRGYAGPIELSVSGHPSLMGNVMIPAGATNPQPNQALALMAITAKADIAPGGYDVRIQAKASINNKNIVKLAQVTELVRQNLGGLLFPPKEMSTQLGVGVTQKPVFVLDAKLARPELSRGIPTNLIVKATREKETTEDIHLAVIGMVPNITIAPKAVPKGKNEIEIPITPAANAPLGTVPVIFRSTTKVGGKDFAYYVGPIHLVIVSPIEVKLEPNPVMIKPGSKVKIKAMTTRKGGYDGPIDIELKNLPANVTAPKTTIAKGQSEAEIEITAAANAAGDKPDVNALATATGAANQQATSANITLRVTK
jgi:hypothetical protein